MVGHVDIQLEFLHVDVASESHPVFVIDAVRILALVFRPVEGGPQRCDLALVGHAEGVVRYVALLEEVFEVVLPDRQVFIVAVLLGMGVPLRADRAVERCTPAFVGVHVVGVVRAAAVGGLFLGNGEEAGLKHGVRGEGHGHSALSVGAVFRRHHDGAARTAVSVKCRCRGSLEHVDGGDVLGGDVAQRHVGVGNTVDDQQRLFATQRDRGGIAEVRGVEYRHAGDLSRKRCPDVDTLYLLQALGRNLLYRISQRLLFTFDGEGRYHDIVQCVGGIFQAYVDRSRVPYRNVLGFHAQEGEHKRLSDVGGDGIVSFGIGDIAAGSPIDEYGGPGEGLSVTCV